MHTIYIIHTYTVGFSALIANSFLSWVIWKKTPAQMKTYSHVLLQNCISDLLFLFSSSIVLLEFQTISGRIFLRSGAPWIPAYGYFPCVSFWAVISSAIGCVWSLYFEMIFRYLTIVKYVSLEPWITWLLFVVSYSLLALFPLDYSLAFCSANSSSFNAALKDMTPWKFVPFMETFRSLDFADTHTIVFVAILLIFVFLINFSYAFCYYKIFIAVKSATISLNALKMQKTLNRRSLLQGITPIIGIACFVAIFVLITSDNGNSYQLLILMSLHYLPLLNPIITILTIYRKVLLRKESSRVIPISQIVAHSMSH